MKQKAVKLIFLLFTAFALLSCSSDKTYEKSYEGYALGTFYSVKYISPEDTVYSIETVMDEIEASLSLYNENSILSRFNRGEKVKADAHFIRVVSAAKDIYYKTDGWFEPTVGKLADRWGFGINSGEFLDSATVQGLLSTVDFRQISVEKDSAITKTNPDIQLDFNAIAKGYAVDAVGGYLEGRGIYDYMVEIGGEVRCRGTKGQGKPWSIGIEDPSNDSPTRRLKAVIPLNDRSVATSGNYRKFKVNEQGIKFVHTINPKTGFAFENDILSASVVADECMTADAYATAFMAMGIARAREIIKRNKDIEVYIVFVDQNGQVQEFVSPSLAPALKK